MDSISMNKIPLTQQGYDMLQKELKHLKEIVKPAIITSIAAAKAQGDLSENAEYHEARKEQSFVEGRILAVEDQLARGEIIDTAKFSGDTVKFGAFVTIENQEDDSVIKYQIVSDCECNIAAKKIPISSPLSRALVNKKIGDYITVNLPNGEKTFKILQVGFRENSESL